MRLNTSNSQFMKEKVILIATIGFLLHALVLIGVMLCDTKEEQRIAAPHIACYSPDDPKISEIEECIETKLLPAHREYLKAVCSASFKNEASIVMAFSPMMERIEQVLAKYKERLAQLFKETPRELTYLDLPEELSALHRSRILRSMGKARPELVAETVWEVVDLWDESLNIYTASLRNNLEPEHTYDISQSFPQSSRSDSWLRKTREQRLANLYVCSLLQETSDAWDSLRYRAGYLRFSDPKEDIERLQPYIRDHRRLLVPLLLNQAREEVLSILNDAFPALDGEYALPDEAKPELHPALVRKMKQESGFVSQQISALLNDYSYEPFDEENSAGEVRQKVEKKIELLKQNMERVYMAQLQYLCEAFSLHSDDFTEEELLNYYDEAASKIRLVFADDMRILRAHASWIPEEKTGSLDSIPAPPMRPMATPSFMVVGSMGEGHSIHFYRKSGDAVRADVRRAYKDALAEGYDLLLGSCHSQDSAKEALRFAHMRSLLDAAEYAWMQYASVIYDLMEPVESLFWGSGTGAMISGQMSSVYENHSRYFTEVLRIYPAAYSCSKADSEDVPDEEG